MKAKKNQKSNTTKKSTVPTGVKNEITGIIILAFGILAMLSYYFADSIGPFGNFIRNLLLGFLGLPSFIIPPAIVVTAVFIILRKNDSLFRKRIIFSAVLILVFSAMIHAGSYHKEKFVNLNLFRSIAQFYTDGTGAQGGGVLGGLAATPFLKIFNVLGTIIIMTTLAIIDIILLTNISVGDFLRTIRKHLRRLGRKILRTGPVTGIDIADENEGPEIVGEGEDMTLEFKPGRKVIDFKIEKTARDLKEKTAFGSINKKFEDIDSVTNEEPIKFIMKDLKPGKPVVKGKQTDNAIIDINISTGNSEGYIYPSAALLNEPSGKGLDARSLKNSAIEEAMKLEETLTSFGVDAKVINVSRGPSVTRYELRPGIGVQVKKIANLADDISLHLASEGVRIEAPIPGKDAVGIEVPNKEVNSVLLREIIESDEFEKNPSKLSFALGRDISGDIVVADIAKMPHVLIAGATGMGKSVCINNLILSLLYKASPDEVRLILVDPKVVELGIYNGIPHLMLPVVTDPKKAAGALNWAVQEMLNRYNLFSSKGVKDIAGYNRSADDSIGEPRMPQIVIIIDELADLMMAAPNDVEDAICRLAQMARAAGMHLVIATQRPSVDVITGVIKANIPSRISFAVTSQVDSRTILDMAGAEKLLGRGDMLFYPSGKPKPIRVQGAFQTESEIEKVVGFIKDQGNVEYNSDLIERLNNENEPVESIPGDNDELLPQAIELVVDAEMASASLIQRKFKVGYARAARIVDQMEARGIVGPHEGSKPRQVLISRQQWQEMQMTSEN